jgi:hypothetical protein
VIIRLNFNPETTDILDFGETLEDLFAEEDLPPEFLAAEGEPGWEYDWNPGPPGNDGDENGPDPHRPGRDGGPDVVDNDRPTGGGDDGAGREHTWGGRRPGAGAPTGNLNALRHGIWSPRLLAYMRALASDPTMQRVIGELMRVTGPGSDAAFVKKALKGVRLAEPRQDHIRRRQRRRRARNARIVERLLAQLPPDYPHIVPPPTLPLDASGHPIVLCDDTGAPFNPITGRPEPIHPMVPASITRAYRRVHRALRRKHQEDIIHWFKEEFMDPPLE